MDMANSDLVVNTTQKMDMLSKQLYIQSRSFDDVVDMCKSHDEMLRCIPAIQPVSNKDLRKTASGYGTRIDPIYGTTKFHAGMDFSAPLGTDVYKRQSEVCLCRYLPQSAGRAMEECISRSGVYDG